MNDLIFEILPFRIFHFYFYSIVAEVFTCMISVFCTRFHVRERHLSDFLNQKFTFSKNYFSGDFVHDIYLDKISLFLHYHGIIYARRDKNFENSYGNFGVLYFEEVDRPFLLYKFYLEILCRVIFNNFLKNVMPIMLNDFDLNENFICRRKRFCDRKACSGNERKQIISILVKKTAFFAFEIVNLNNIYPNIEAFKHIFYNYKKKC